MKCITPATVVALLLSISAGTSKAGFLPSLCPSTFIDASAGLGIGSGAVSTGHTVFHFDALAGDAVTLEVIVTQILPGTEFEDDDSKLFLFSSDGRLFAENDDFGLGFQSKIEDFVIPFSDTWFAAVTTFGNSPLFNADAIISGWEDDGGSNIEFDLVVSVVPAAVPEPSTVTLFGTGVLGVVCYAGCKRKRKRIGIET